MKSLIIAFLMSLMLQVSYAQSEQTLQIKTRIYCDHCMYCESCGANIISKIRVENKGIRKIKIDSEKQLITVVYKPKKTSADAIRKAISTAGFDADDVPASPEGVAKLEGCCKKPTILPAE